MGSRWHRQQEIKKTYQKIRDENLVSTPEVDLVPLFIEPLDTIEIGAWPAKAGGILTIAKKSLHFELPLYTLFERRRAEAYMRKFSLNY